MHHPNESSSARALRAKLHEAEVALRDQRERVAELRRSLPRDTESEDYAIEWLVDGKKTSGRLGDLFSNPEKPLVLMHFMWGKAQTSPCPMCTMWADGYAGTVEHLSDSVNFAVVVAGDVAEFGRYAASRGWKGLTLVSAAKSRLKQDLGFESGAGGQMPGVSVIERAKDGRMTHFYSVCAFGPDGGRMMDLLSPVWNFLDLVPTGRGDWMPRGDYNQAP